MSQKWIAGMIAVFAVLAFAGVGFALAYQSTATISTNATAGSFAISLTPSVYTSSLSDPTSESCGFSGSGLSVTLSPTNLLPGDYCEYQVTIEDTGSLPGTVGVSSSCNSGYATICADFTFSDNSASFSPAVSVAAGGYTSPAYLVTITGVTYTSSTAEWTTTVTGTAA